MSEKSAQYVIVPMVHQPQQHPYPTTSGTGGALRTAAMALIVVNALLFLGLAATMDGSSESLFGESFFGVSRQASRDSAVSEDSSCPIQFREVDQFGIYTENRNALARKISSAKNENNFVFIVGGKQLTRLGSDTDLAFRQDSDFLYLTGYDRADLYLAFSLKAPFDTYLFYPPPTETDIIFNGAKEDTNKTAARYGFKDVLPNTALISTLARLFPNATEALTTDVSNLVDTVPDLSKKFTISGGVLSTLRSMRQVKTDKELEMIRIAAKVSAAAHIEAMKAAGDVVRKRGSWFEAGAENVFRFITNSCNMKIQAYLPIVGAGIHSGVLHYEVNDDIIEKDSVVLVDAAAEYKGYASDITRTYPANGKFSKKQRDVYEIVLAAQEAAIAAIKPGILTSSLSQISKTTLLRGLLEKGFVTGTLSQLELNSIDRVFMPHGLSHGVGLDVHDPSATVLTERSVLTIEPGVYFIPYVLEKTRADSVKSKFINWTLVDSYSNFGGVRIEDVIIVGNGTPEIVSYDAPKSIEAIEALMLGR